VPLVIATGGLPRRFSRSVRSSRSWSRT
jgi:hypothetical protein